MASLDGLRALIQTTPGKISAVATFLASVATVLALAAPELFQEARPLSPNQQALLAGELRAAFGRGQLTEGSLHALCRDLAQRHGLPGKRVEELVRERAPQIRLAGDSLTRGVRLVREGRFDQAHQEFLSATRNDPEDARGWSNLGASYALEARYGEAREAYDRALALDGHDAATRYNFGVLLARMGNHKDALQQLRQALSEMRSQAARRALLDQAVQELKEAPDLEQLRREPGFAALFGDG